MHRIRHVAVVDGSLCRRSRHRQLAAALAQLAPGTLRLEPVDISRLAPYRPALEHRPPPEWTLFRQQIRASDGVLFIIPQRDDLIPGVLRNALAVGANPEGRSAWEGKPGTVVSVSAQGYGTFGANHLLLQALGRLDITVMREPWNCPGRTIDLMSAEDHFLRARTCHELRSFMGEFGAWVNGASRH